MDRTLPNEIEVLPGTKLDDAWAFFESLDALHHEMRICNPMLDADLDAVIDRLDGTDGATALDIACGHGELLIRLTSRSDVLGTGIDLSPWALRRAVAAAAVAPRRGRIRWILGDGARAPAGPFDIVSCLGASWIWDGFGGTVAAVVDRLASGGRCAIGDLYRREGVDPSDLDDDHAGCLSLDEQVSILERNGLRVMDRLVVSQDAWDGYQDRIQASVAAYVRRHPGPQAERYETKQREWREAHADLFTSLGWVLWLGHR